MKPVFTPAVIDELRQRVIAHNSALNGVSRGTHGVKLTKLKGLYKRFFSGQGETHALAKIDQHLDNLRRDAFGLAKAEPPFDEGRHPRGRGGQFRPAGGGHQVRQIGVINRSTIAEHHGDGTGGDELLQAAQTQVIPETRYSTFMPPVAGAAGLLIGGISGAGAQYGGTKMDRAVNRAAGRLGYHAGRTTAGALITPAITGARLAARAGARAGSHLLGVHIPRPGPTAGLATIARAKDIGGAGGRRIAHAASRISSVVSNVPPASARKLVELNIPGRKGRIMGRGAGALMGAGLTGGLVYGPILYHAAGGAGRWMDALFPRRVRKAFPLLDAPEVLAKQDELLGLDELTKANVGRLASSLIRTGRRLLTSRVPAVPVPEPQGIGPQAARSTFWLHNQPGPTGFRVRRHGGTRALRVAQYAVPTAIAGAGVGAIGGAATGYAREKWQEYQHPRTAHGRFTHKGAQLGAKIGAAVGAGLGVGAGLLAARRGHGQLLAAAVNRIGLAAEDMRQSATRGARQVHAQTHLADNRKTAALKDLEVPPGSTVSHEQIKTHLEDRAVRAWNQGEGAAIRGGHEAWYKYQVDRLFDAEVRRQMPGIAATLPRKGGGTISTRTGGNFLNHVDEAALVGDQKTMWDGLVDRHQKTIDEIEHVYTTRRNEATELARGQSGLDMERRTIQRELTDVPKRLTDLDDEDAPLRQVRSFAKQRMGIELGQTVTLADGTTHRTTRETAHQYLSEQLPHWVTERTARLDRIGQELPEATNAAEAARVHASTELSAEDLGGITNRFHARAGQFLKPMPDFKTREAEVAKEASKEFVAESDKHAAEAEGFLKDLLTAEEFHLKSRMPRDLQAALAFDQTAPGLASWARQFRKDYSQLSQADVAGMGQTLKDIHSVLTAHTNPAVAFATMKRLSVGAARQAGDVKNFLLHNWKYVASIVGLGSAFGAVDLTAAPGDWFKGKKHWKKPQGMRYVHEWPDPVGKPNEMLMGIAYRDRGREKFLQGIHIYSADGAHNIIPVGADVEQVIGRVRQRAGGGGGGGGDHQQASAIPVSGVSNEKAVTDRIATLQGTNHIRTVNLPNDGRSFRERVGGDVGNDERAVAEGFYNNSEWGLGFLDRPQNRHLDGRSTNRPDNYFRGLQQLFDAPNSAILSRAARVGLLIGGGPFNHRRGIFATPNPIYTDNPNANRVKDELIRQIARSQPRNNAEFHQLYRALHIVGEHFNLSQDQQREVYSRLQAARSARPNQQQQQGQRTQGQQQGEQQQGGAAPQHEDKAAHKARTIEQIVASIPASERTPHPNSGLAFNDARLRDTLSSLYDTHDQRVRANPEHRDKDETEKQSQVAAAVTAFADRNFRKQEPFEGLRKYLTQDPGYPKIGGQRQSPMLRPPIAQATAPQENPGTFRGDLRAATRPKQVATQIASYGLGQAGSEAAFHLAQHFMPGKGIIPAIARWGAGSIGGLGAGTAGLLGAPKVASMLGDKSQPRTQSPNESLLRAGAGVGGQLAGAHFAPQIAGAASRAAQAVVPGAVQRGVSAVAAPAMRGLGNVAGAAARGVGRVATAGLGEKIGGKIGGWLGGAAGSAAEPGGGTAAGWIAGTAIGTGVGWLADEGVGLLYRHLNRYGSHVPHMAAKSLGVPPAKRQAAATGALG